MSWCRQVTRRTIWVYFMQRNRKTPLILQPRDKTSYCSTTMNRVQPTMRMPYINRAFSNSDKRSTTLSLIENTIFGYMKLYASSTFVPSSGGDNNPRKRRNYDDIDDMNDEERKGLSYRWYFSLRTIRYLFLKEGMSIRHTLSFPAYYSKWELSQ